MKVECVVATGLTDDLVAVGIPVFVSAEGPRLGAGVNTPTAGPAGPAFLDAAWCKRQGFTGKVGQTLAFLTSGTSPLVESESMTAVEGPTASVLVGLGEPAKLVGDAGVETMRRAAAAFIRAVGSGETAALLLPRDVAISPEQMGAAAAEGALLASYRYDAFRTAEPPEGLGRLLLVVESPEEAGAAGPGCARGARVAESTALARDLVNEPPSSLTPQRFAEVMVERFADVPEISVEVWDEDRIAAEKLGGLLGVARGSAQPPRLVKAEYQPSDPLMVEGRTPHVALVGKGITFDSGGLSLKTPGGMETMKTDMGGAAAVMCALDAIAALKARIRVTVFTPLTENMPSGTAIKPSDVLTARNGKTIEVLNTDAEGRLVLADGLSLAVESGADAIIDLATLTGAAVVALGKEIAGLLGNDENLMEQVEAASERSGEPVWPLPLPDDYRNHIDSEVADMRNVGRPGQAGSISAALLLREFVGDVPWAHLDIAGPARSDDNLRYLTKGGTGFGVRLLVELVTSDQFASGLVANDRRVDSVS
ncbi:MAG TPA: leucyl aminopeptidase [Acidimicrobiales bacterium]|nr:leucyl aminopeptidase [Acidimicrobiales bacterium]